ncbi:MAG: fused MFS/spermidine synthase [Lachnospiraceae bacterium]|nr:fused MFS/spermidine synthase [Lachnospiraceae bacterium]
MNESRKKVKADTFEGEDNVMVQDCLYGGESVRLLLVNGTRESATYLLPGKRNEMVFNYMKHLNQVYEIVKGGCDTLLLGGAGFAYPKYYISHYPKSRMDVVELNSYMYELAMEYFFLKDLYRDYDLENNGRLQVFIEDGSQYLVRNEKHYDVIINDAYHGIEPDKGLISEDTTREIRRGLKMGGVYVANIITALKGSGAILGQKTMEVFKAVFPYVEAHPCEPNRNPTESQNIMFVASDKKFEWVDFPE